MPRPTELERSCLYAALIVCPPRRRAEAENTRRDCGPRVQPCFNPMTLNSAPAEVTS
jgi:hypothetical protein